MTLEVINPVLSKLHRFEGSSVALDRRLAGVDDQFRGLAARRPCSRATVPRPAFTITIEPPAASGLRSDRFAGSVLVDVTLTSASLRVRS